MDCSPPGSSVRGIFQARILKWVAISYFRGSSLLRDQTHVSCVSCIGRQILYHCTTWEAGKGGFRHSPRLHNGRAWICTLASWRALKSEPLGSGSWKEAWASLLCCFTVKLRIQAREEFLILVTCKVITQISKHAVTPGPLTDKQIHLEARNVTIKEGLNYWCVLISVCKCSHALGTS